MEENFNKELEDFILRLLNGEPLSDPKDLQFYLNHSDEIEKYLKDVSRNKDK